MYITVEQLIKPLILLRQCIKAADYPPPDLRWDENGNLEIVVATAYRELEIGNINTGLEYSSVQNVWVIDQLVYADYRIKRTPLPQSDDANPPLMGYSVECDTGEPDLEEAIIKLYLMLPPLDE